jgi:tetratricopeptide (TPR) repeat protein
MMVSIAAVAMGCSHQADDKAKSLPPLQLANLMYDLGNYDSALVLVNGLLLADSLDVSAHELRGKLLYHFSDTTHAEAELHTAIDLSLTDSAKEKIIENIISWEIDGSNKEAARKKLKEELSLYKSDKVGRKRVLDHVAHSYIELGDTTEAIQSYEMALKEFKDWEAAHVQLANLFLATGKWGKAASHYEACERTTLHKNVQYNLGQCYLKLGNKSSAIARFKSASELGHAKACENYRELTARTEYSVSSRCCDGTSSSSTGRGTCSHHHGVCGLEYTPYKVYTVQCK